MPDFGFGISTITGCPVIRVHVFTQITFKESSTIHCECGGDDNVL